VIGIDASSPDTIYYDYNAGLSGDFSRTSPVGDKIGTTVAFVANPYRAGELIGFGNGKDNRLYAAEKSNSVAKVDWRCADPAPAGSIPKTLEFTRDGRYFVGTWDGNVYAMTLPLPLAGGKSCAQGSSAGNPTLIYSEPNGHPVQVVEDPRQLGVLYALVPAETGAGRVLQLIFHSGTGWVASPLGVALPAADVTALAVDPILAGHLYVGTEHGLWEGTPGSNGQYSWVLSPEIPDTRVTVIVAQRSVAGYSGTMELSAFGRSIWERHVP
jgi:outer membrane protein assembly factor BamB